jgi:hypothetical protein
MGGEYGLKFPRGSSRGASASSYGVFGFDKRPYTMAAEA